MSREALQEMLGSRVKKRGAMAVSFSLLPTYLPKSCLWHFSHLGSLLSSTRPLSKSQSPLCYPTQPCPHPPRELLPGALLVKLPVAVGGLSCKNT